MVNIRIMVVVAAVAQAAFGGGPARRMCVPGTEAWRGSSTTLVLTNTESGPTRVTVMWIIGAPRDYAPPPFELMLHGHETRLIDVGSEVLRGREAAGAVEFRADGVVAAYAVVKSRGDPTPVVFNAIPVRQAVGTGRSATLAGFNGAGGYRLFAAEVTGHPIYFSATAFAGDDVQREKRYYLEGSHQATLQIDREFSLPAGQPFTLILRAVNGSGRLVAAGATITATQHIVVSEMNASPQVRHRMRALEMLTYGVVAMALVVALFYRKKS